MDNDKYYNNMREMIAGMDDWQKWQVYEGAKRQLQTLRLTPAGYERRVRELAEALGI